MPFGFRVVFRVNARGTFKSDQESIEFMAGSQPLKLSSLLKDTPIGEADRFSIKGVGFASPEAAADMAESVRHALLLSSIRKQRGLDLGQSSVQSFSMSPWLKEQLGKATGEQIIEDRMGVTVFSTDPPPRFVGVDASATGAQSADTLIEDLGSIIGSYSLPTGKAEIAIGLYGLSHFVGRAPARFLLLVIALEALLDYAPRSPQAVDHLDSLIQQTESSSLTKEEKDAICSTLSFAKNISINEAGKRLAEESLGDVLYDGQKPREFFAKIYKVRSELVHRGKIDPPAMHTLVGEVDRFVSDILLKQFVPA